MDEVTRIRAIQQYLRSGTYPPNTSKNEKRIIRKATEKGQYELEGTRLFYNTHVGQDGNKRLLYITEEQQKLKLLDQCHNGAAAHNAVNPTLQRLSTSHYWRGMKDDVKRFCEACDACQRQVKVKTMAPELKPIKVVEPWHMVGMDLIGPLKETPLGNRFVLTITDYFTKFVDFHPLKRKSAEEVSKGLKTFFYRWGPPKKLLSDQGREFVNQINDALAAEFKVKRMVTSAYRPQTNGLDERTNQTLKVRLSKMVNDQQNDWDQHLEAVAFSMRTSVQWTTKFSPYFLMFRRQPVLPHHMDMNDNPEEVDLDQLQEDMASANVEEFVTSTEAAIAEVDKKVLENVASTQEKQKAEYARKKTKGVRVFDLKVGDKVLRRNMRLLTRKGGQMEKKWLGPFRIGDISEKQTLLLIPEGQTEPLKVRYPYDQVKPYKEPLQTCTDKMSTSFAADKEEQTSNTDDHIYCRLEVKVTPETVKEEEERPGNLYELEKERPENVQGVAGIRVHDVSAQFLSLCADATSTLLPGHFQMKNFFSGAAVKHPVSSLLNFVAAEEPDRFEEVVDMIRNHDAAKTFFESGTNRTLFGGDNGINQMIDILHVAASVLLYADQHSCNVEDVMETLKEFPSHLRMESQKRIRSKKLKKFAVGNTTVEETDLSTLKDQQWLNDKVIHAFLGLLAQQNSWHGQKRVHILPCFIAVLWKQSRYDEWLFPKVCFADFTLVFLPVCTNHHWTLVVMDMEKKTVDVLDSLDHQQKDEEFLVHWQKYIHARSKTVTDDIPSDGWIRGNLSSSQQMNGSDCGVFILMNAEAILQGKKPAVMRQCHAANYRRYVELSLTQRAKRVEGQCEIPVCYNEGCSEWVQCERCQAWCHLPCANIQVGIEHLAEISFVCILCQLD